MNQQFVAAYEQVGGFVVSKTNNSRAASEKERLAKQGGNVVTYLCTPEGEVLDVLVGQVPAEALRDSLERALDLASRLKRADSPSQRRRIAHEFHSHRLLDGALESWRRVMGKSASLLRPPIRDAHDAEARVRDAGKAARTAPNPHWNTGLDNRQREVLLLASSPLASVADLEKPVFEQYAGQTHRRAGRRLQLLTDRVGRSIQQRRPVLMVVDAQQRWAQKSASEDILRHRRIGELSDRCTIVRLDSLELTRLLDELDMPPLDGDGRNVLQAVLLDGRGKQALAHYQRYSVQVLARVLEEKLAEVEEATDEGPNAAGESLAEARRAFEQDRAVGVARLSAVVKQHPNTPAAAEAQEMIDAYFRIDFGP